MRAGGAVMGLCALGLSACAIPASSGGAPDSARAASVPAAAASMVGTRWKGVDTPADERHLPWLEFVVEGRLSGFTGCNLLHGAWRNEGGAVRIGPLVTTKRACAGAEGNIEKLVLAALTPQARVTREGDRLVFTGVGGERLEFVEVK